MIRVPLLKNSNIIDNFPTAYELNNLTRAVSVNNF